jgi:hypothetical protein
MVFLVVGILFILNGCSRSGQPFTEFETPIDNKGIVYVYRPDNSSGNNLAYNINVNNAITYNYVAGKLLNGGYIKIYLPVGKNEIYAEPDTENLLTLNIKDKDVSCIRGSINTDQAVTHLYLSVVNMDTCKSEIVETKNLYIPPSNKSNKKDAMLKCARMKNGVIIQKYDGQIKDGRVIINGDDYTSKYAIIEIDLYDMAKTRIKGHFCNIVEQ